MHSLFFFFLFSFFFFQNYATLGNCAYYQMAKANHLILSHRTALKAAGTSSFFFVSSYIVGGDGNHHDINGQSEIPARWERSPNRGPEVLDFHRVKFPLFSKTLKPIALGT